MKNEDSRAFPIDELPQFHSSAENTVLPSELNELFEFGIKIIPFDALVKVDGFDKGQLDWTCPYFTGEFILLKPGLCSNGPGQEHKNQKQIADVEFHFIDMVENG